MFVYQNKNDLDNDQLGQRIRQINYCCSPNHSISYTYDNVGNILTADVGGYYGWAFGYDNIYQVTDANQLFATNRQVDFSYDNVYNRTSWQDTLDSVNVGYDTNAVHQYTAVGATTPTYDAKGNITTGYGGGYTLTYDEENRLVSAGPYISYTYDLLGRRVSQTYSITTYYVYDGSHIIAEYNSTGSLIRKYIYGPGIDNPVALIYVSGGYECWFYYYTDALGSIRLITHASGVPVESYTYDVYGQPRVMYGAGDDGNWLTEDVMALYFSEVGNPYMFTGRWWDYTTQLYHYRARDYSPTLGRFLQTDPAGYIDTMNLYAYCGNNPINWIDPWGLWPEGIHDDLIDRAYPNLSREDRDAIRRGSVDADTHQAPAESFMHAMRNGTTNPAQTVDDARQQMQNYRDNELARYRSLKASAECLTGSDRAQKMQEAYEALGRALHPVMDSTSPSHEGFQAWRGIMAHPIEANQHRRAEKTITPERRQETINRMHQYNSN